MKRIESAKRNRSSGRCKSVVVYKEILEYELFDDIMNTNTVDTHLDDTVRKKFGKEVDMKDLQKSEENRSRTYSAGSVGTAISKYSYPDAFGFNTWKRIL